jgi:hypothetical protein
VSNDVPRIRTGTVVRSSAVFKNTVGAEADPPTLNVRWKPPSGSTVVKTSVDVEVVHDSTGNYHMDFLVPKAEASEGRWKVQWEGEDMVVQADPDEFIAAAPAVS